MWPQVGMSEFYKQFEGGKKTHCITVHSFIFKKTYSIMF